MAELLVGWAHGSTALSQPLTRPQLALLWANVDKDKNGVLGNDEGQELLKQALTVQGSMRMRCSRESLANLQDALDQYGSCSSDSMCCGALVFGHPKLRKAIQEAQKEVQDTLLLTNWVEQNASMALKDLINPDDGRLYQDSFVAHGGEVIYSYASGQATLFLKAVRDFAKEDRMQRAVSVDSKQSAGKSFMPLRNAPESLSPFIENSMDDYGLADTDAQLFRAHVRKTNDPVLTRVNTIVKDDDKGGAESADQENTGIVGLFRDLWSSSRSEKENAGARKQDALGTESNALDADVEMGNDRPALRSSGDNAYWDDVSDERVQDIKDQLAALQAQLSKQT